MTKTEFDEMVDRWCGNWSEWRERHAQDHLTKKETACSERIKAYFSYYDSHLKRLLSIKDEKERERMNYFIVKDYEELKACLQFFHFVDGGEDFEEN